MAKFKVLAGSHEEGRDANRRLFVKGDIVESNRPLDKIFVNKFQRVDADTPSSKGERVEAGVEDDENTDDNNETKAVELVDVTEDFKQAEQKGLVVKRNEEEKTYHVFLKDDLDNEEFQGTAKKQVKAFISEYGEE